MSHIGRYNVVLTHIPDIGKVNAAAVTANYQASFPMSSLSSWSISGAIPFEPKSKEIILGNVIISIDTVQYNLGWQLLEAFLRKDLLLLFRAQTVLAQLKSFRGQALNRR
ncbi:hypothetical protein EDB81DRAFT_919321 [Dactylonectria macrodidyma]|uniref:Uncharacterized protein n=1 Tax=Dactylonectria macrodidyma TaxID=307937 RepID=A0A9P9DAD1_9HYPO|nr:hypothetical protein EDB81DRAFT_919321 [Dactylonectria macrodidyma]